MYRSKTFKKAKARQEKGLGGLIGTGVGAVAGSVIPGAGTAIGASIGGALGNGVDGIIANNKAIDAQNKENLNIRKSNLGTGSYNFGMMEDGGVIPNSVMNIGQDALKFNGPSHEEGGIPLDENIEVEGEETMDNIEGSDYVFSKKLTVPGSDMSFAQAHEKLVSEGASEEEVKQLANMQEKVAGRSKKFKYGGKLKRKYRR